MESQEFVSQGQPYGFPDEISNIWTTANVTDPFFTAEGYQYPEFQQSLAFDSFPRFEAEKSSEGKSSVGDMPQPLLAAQPPSLSGAMSSAFPHRYNSNPRDISTQAMFARPITHPTPIESFDRSTAKRVRIDPEVNKHECQVVDKCFSQTGSQSTCCSSCSDGEPCVDPECAEEVVASCGECACGIPKCSCPEHDDTPRNREIATNSDGFLESRLQDWTNSTQHAWNPQSPRMTPAQLEISVDQSYGLYNSIPYSSVEQSPMATTPSAVNMSTPFSPTTGLPTPSNYGAQSNSYDPNLGILSGAGAIFQPPPAAIQWTDSEYDQDNSQFPMVCAWEACEERFQSNEDWLAHCFDTHVAPQMTLHCPIQQASCPENIAPNFLNHMTSNHGYDFTAPSQPLMCPAPDCDPDRVIPNAYMFQTHFSRAHAMPAQGSLLCEVQRCNTTFNDLNEFSTHLTHQHLLKGGEAEIDLHHQAGLVRKTTPPTKTLVDVVMPPPAQEADDEAHVCLWSGIEGKTCGSSFESAPDLHRHIVKEHLASLDKKSGYKCCWKGCTRADKRGNEKCGFSQRGKLERHMASHTNCKSAPYPYSNY
jgi:hypothetical protein